MSDGSVLRASCKEIHTAEPSVPTGTYSIDPDGAGGASSISVTCDMTTAGGGWTIVFLATTTNFASPPVAYTSASSRLLSDAQSALIAYRNATQDAAANYATFPLPAAWKTSPPFSAPGTDLPTEVSVNGAPPTAATLRFGTQSFSNYCTDPWVTTGSQFGRLCVVGTNAPFFAAFADAYGDSCSDSQSAWSSVACTTDRRMSIAVR